MELVFTAMDGQTFALIQISIRTELNDAYAKINQIGRLLWQTPNTKME